MATTQTGNKEETSVSRRVDHDRQHGLDRASDHTIERSVQTEPLADSWKILATGGMVPLGLAIAAAATSYLSKSDRVANTAWIAVAVAGTASVISAAAVAHRRTVHVERDGHKAIGRESSVDFSREKA